MPNLSTITIAGHIGRDADIKSAGGSAVCEFSVAVTTKRKDGDSTAWYRCQLWGTRGEKLAPRLTKGKAVIVNGELVPREYKGKNDEMRMSLDVNVQSLTFAGGSGAGAGEGRSDSRSAPSPAPSAPADDDELPF